MSFRKWFFAPRAVALALVFVVFGAVGALAQTSAYVTNVGDSTVSVIDTGTSSVTATVPVGAVPFSVAATPDGAFVWVGNLADGTISRIDTASDTVVGLVPTESFPTAIAFTPDGAFAYVGRFSGDVAVIDTATFLTTDVIPVGIPEVDIPSSIAFTPDGAFAYVTSGENSPLVVIDTVTKTVSATILDVGNAAQAAVTPNGAFVYMPDLISTPDAGVFVVDTASNTIVDKILTDPGPATVAITPSGAFVYVAHRFDTVSVINTAKGKVVATVPVPGTHNGIAVTPDGALAYVTNVSTNRIDVIDTATNTVTGSVSVGADPLAIAFSPPLPPPSPTRKDQCKNGGWQIFTNPTFNNQGECITYVNGL